MKLPDQMKRAIDKGMSASKDIASKAGAKAKELGQKGMLRLEILQLKSRADRLSQRLGDEAYDAFMVKGHVDLKKDAPQVSDLLGEIHDIRQRIDGKEAEYRAIGGKVEDLVPAKREE